MTRGTGYSCDKHGISVPAGTPCPDCVEAWTNRRAPNTMTVTERADEFRWWGNILTIPFPDMHKRIEELVGRPVWTHELSNPGALIDEIESGERATMETVVDKIPEGKPIIFIDPTD
jgi:hypothetical protein